MFLAIALLTLLLAATWLYTDRKKRFSMFRDLGIPGPPPSFLTGNLHEITEKGITAAADSWIKTYGNIIGFYSGSVPYVMINDAGWAKKILLEETHSFQAKGMMLAVLDYHPVISTNFSLRWGEPWKRMRSIVSPSFTPSSLKETFSVMSSCVDDFVGSLQDYACSGTAINVCEHCDILALEVIMRCVMGVETDAQKGGSREEQDLMRRVTTRRGTIMAGKFRIILNCLSEFPRFWWFILYLRTALLRLPVDNLGAYIKTIIKIRRLKYKGSGSTALDLMLSAEVAHSRSPKKATPETTTKGATTETSTAPNNQKPSINAVEILSTTGMLLVVGFETTSTALGYTLYLLAKHQDVQEKTRDEATALLQEHGEFNYENVMGMQYLDQVISESLRIYPPAVGVTSRKSGKDFVHEGIRIPKGTSVLIPTFQFHRNPKFWPDADKFDPERFSPARRGAINPITYQPFGYGHRMCVGARFARLELMLSVAKVLTKYRLFLDEDHHKGDLNFCSWFMETYAKGGIWIKFKNT